MCIDTIKQKQITRAQEDEAILITTKFMDSLRGWTTVAPSENGIKYNKPGYYDFEPYMEQNINSKLEESNSPVRIKSVHALPDEGWSRIYVEFEPKILRTSDELKECNN